MILVTHWNDSNIKNAYNWSYICSNQFMLVVLDTMVWRLLSALYDAGVYEAKSYNQNECFEAGVLFAKNEGIIPPEPACN